MQDKLFKSINTSGVNRTTPHGIFNPAAMAIELEQAPVRIGEKPGGTDVGHLILVDGKPVIIKAGVSLSLLGRAAERYASGKEQKAEMFLGFIVGSFTRITMPIPTLSKSASEEEKKAVKELLAQKKEFENSAKKTMFSAFKEYLTTDEGQQFLEKLRNNEELTAQRYTTDDVYRIAHFMIRKNNALRDIIALPTFADIISGSYSQQFNNVFQLTRNLEVAKQAIVVRPEALFQASYFLPDAKPFDTFLLESFRSKPAEGQSEADWLAQCRADLKARLSTISLNGLCSGILLRLIMGESADSGPDNMVIGSTGIINVDLTGFRYPRENNSEEFKNLGWSPIFKLDNAEELLNSLFDPTVFKNRYITNDKQIGTLNEAESIKIPQLAVDKSNEAEVTAAKDKVKKLSEEYSRYCAEIQKAVVAELKNCVGPLVVDEVNALKEWAAGIKVDLVNESMERSMVYLHHKLSPEMKFSSAHLDTLFTFNAQFTTRLVAVATEVVNEMKRSATPSANNT